MSNDSNRQDENSIDTGISSSSNDLFYTREMSDILYFTEEENENYYTQQDLSNNFLSNNSLSDNSLSNNPLSNNSLSEITANNQKKRKHPGGKKIGEIWNYFIKSTDLGRGFYEAEYRWCNEKWSRGHPKDMKIHLARNCEKPQITKHFDRITSVPITKSNEIDQAILKAWVCCEFPFQTIENPFIIDLFRISIPGYTLPSRDTLSGLDGWTSSRHDSIYNYIVTTSTRKEYLIKLKNYNIEKQTEKFVAIVTDHGANLKVARRIIHEKYSFILDLRCIAHAINLIASDFAEIDSVKKIISNCGSIIGFFNNSHAAHEYYKEQLNIMKIKGGEIQSYCKTRWGTLYTTADSIIRSKPVFNWILENHPQVITNKNVFTLLQNEEFYFNCYQIASILKPVKELTNIFEARNANLANCFIGLIKLGAKINQIQPGNQWKSIIISNYNRHLGEFINNINILAYWLHPLYRKDVHYSQL
ncbi:hypothetical protein Glove_110g41 [Diversispora epigaea]|uniref:Uncharacterized protein n=1 Tax=Diversispora epigaea TaxID=1348612 RepID=A0A397J5F8_9GLOM|nr:hypothetical protein Glove_110g41 [Diversispora epigaea]